MTVASTSVPAKRNARRALSDCSIVSDLVAHTPYGGNRAVVAELAPELAHVNVHCAGVAREGVAPHPLEQLVAREHEAAVVEQLPQEVELLGGELDVVARHRHLAAAGVDAQLAVLHRRFLRLALGAGGAAEDRLDPRDELAWVERLGEVIVGADLESDDLVHVV